MTSKHSPTIQEAIEDYLAVIAMRNEQTGRTYRNALRKFCQVLQDNGLPCPTSPVQALHEDTVVWLIEAARELAPATERLYLEAVVDFFKFLEAEELRVLNMVRVRRIIKMRARRPGRRLPQFPKEEIDTLVEKVETLIEEPQEDPQEWLRNLRDRALILTLADTGLRIHEACNLDRGSIDFNSRQAVIIGKGDKQAVIRFSERSITAIQDYLRHRTTLLDGQSHRPLQSLPVFARHDRGAGKKVKRILPRTGQNILTDRVRQFLGPEWVQLITPHSLRHYFVTRVLSQSGNLKLAKELARHENIGITERYAHLSDRELDERYGEIFDKLKKVHPSADRPTSSN